MKRSFKILISTGFLFTGLLASDYAQAQYKGSYAPQAAEQEDPATKPIPKIFSSQVSSQQQAERLDIIYENLKFSLWMEAKTTFLQQKRLYDNLDDKNFKYTRYAREFETDLQPAMERLNNSYLSIMNNIDKAKANYPKIKEGIRTIDYEILDPLWAQEIQEFQRKAKLFFEMQNKFLQQYRKLASFILKNPGRYYYDGTARKLRFYDVDLYGEYVKYIDGLRKLTYKQSMLIQTLEPANLEPNQYLDIPLEE